ncbi:TonB-dependent receptor [Maribacter algarum]|uniref:TonB-dependent receptor n=1 Tax=Maribacter algarum (ex Zhang et al. 2020) TaxID=2578118 RepID=A0A5S3PS33_9FLAO|nr:TonB-dependent receptor [Maribacter algarum]TMM56713.1 TonB-dependent receptor [Maribacter algarum]
MKNYTILALFVLVHTFFYGQEQTQDTIKIAPVEVTALRSSSPLKNLPVNVVVVNQRAILETQPPSATEILKYIPGVVVQNDGGITSTPIIRGLSRERAPILIDGNSFVGGRIRSYALIDPWQVERVEVIKGPASAFWGSDAVSGLVNVITRKAENGYGKDFKVGASLYGGYQSVNSYSRGRLEVEGRGNGFDFLIGGGIRDASNTDTPGGEIPNSQFKSNYFDWNIGYSPAENHRFEFSGKIFKNEDVGFPGGLGAPGPPIRVRLFSPDEQTGYNFNYTGKKLSSVIEEVGFSAYFKQQRLHIDQVTNVRFPNTMNVNRRIDVNLDVDVDFGGIKAFTALRLAENSKLTVGADYLREHRFGTKRELVVDIFNPMGVQVNQVAPPPGQIQPDSYATSIGIFAVEEWKVSDAVDLLIALRYDNVKNEIESEPFFIPAIASLYNADNSSDNNSALTGNIGAKFHASEKSDFSVNLANSFRGPDLFSKYNFADGVIPNPDLGPEKGIFYELGYAYDSDNFDFNLNFYQNFVNDLYVPVSVDFQGTPNIQNQAIGKAKLTGLEYQLSHTIGKLSSVFLTGSYIRGKNEITNDDLAFMPANQNILGFQIRNNSDTFFGRFETVIVGEQDKPAPTERETDSYNLFNLSAGFNLHNLFSNFPYSKFVLSVDNLVNEEYQSHVFRGTPGNQTRFLAPGRSINAQLIIRLGVAGKH